MRWFVYRLEKSKYKYEIIKITQQCIFPIIHSSKIKFILGTIYLKPDSNLDIFCSEFNNLIAFINNKYFDCPLIVGGDFNARIGNLNQLNQFLLPRNCKMSFLRSNVDKIINKRGRELVRCMEENGCFVFNERSSGDC